MYALPVNELIFSNGVDHRGPDVGVAQKRLNRAYVVVRLQKMSRERMAERVRCNALGRENRFPLKGGDIK
jgi:hypothetical protein